jgi:pimeloyl-ACP methyl ester carboxylesterase
MSRFNITEHVVDGAYIREYPRGMRTSQEAVPKIHVNEYTPKDNPSPQPGDITIIGAHANGFPKELYEPLWDELLAVSAARGFRIRSILIADAAWQGRSGILNEGIVGNEPGWFDYTRDMLQVINTLRPPRPLVGVGHSFGGNAMVNLALMNPRLLSTIVLLDPVISRWSSNATGSVAASPAASSAYRRDIWPSREEAAAAFARSPFFRSWDPRVLDAWVRHGLRDTPTPLHPDPGAVTLTTTRHQEVFTYFRPSWPAYDAKGENVLRPDLVPDLDSALSERFYTFPVYRSEGAATTERLPHVRPGVLYIFGADSDLSTPDLREEKMRTTGAGVGGSGGRTAGRVEEVTMEKRGHLVPMEAPAACAQEAARWIGQELSHWRREEAEFQEWRALPEVQKTTITDEWRERLGRPERPAKAAKADAKAKI